MKINVNYKVVSKRWDNVRYFLRRGHFLRLLWDRAKWHWFPRLNIVPAFPQTVDVEASLNCQLKCPMCTRAQSSEFDKGGLMDFELYRKIVDECAAHRVFSLKLSWRGEPTTNPRLVEMVRYAKQRGIPDVAFLTNGGLITPAMAEALVDAGLDWISFSIDGLREEYERIRAPITFDEIVAVVRGLHDLKKRRGTAKPLVRIQTISGCIARTPEYFTFWEPWVDRISVIAEQHREDPSRIRHDPDYVCQSPFQRVFITWDGKVVPCHGDYFLHNVMGDVNDESLRDIWMNERFRTFRRDMRARRRLDYEACAMCPDGGEYVGDTLEVDGRIVPVIRYLDNEEPCQGAGEAPGAGEGSEGA